MSPLPDLDDPCGEHLRFRDLIACGETHHRLTAELGAPFDNVPREPETFAALRALAEAVLDPLWRRFGPVEITYAFASPRLTRHIRARIHPPLDQHAGHERDGRGKLVCPRGGAAADLRVAGHDSREVALWIAEQTAFDRIYFYAPERPLHVSVGPDESRQIVAMRPGPSGRLIPRVVSAGRLGE